ncbi:MAG: DUF4124 domain-containing protein [Gammaproteobacteria bacterium]|nr:DUF4124 domain-containing protein [Gammaproteobacteria bacterium]
MRYLLATLLLFALPGEAAEIVKCTKADGSVVYTEAPCPAGAEAEKMNIASRPSDPEAVKARREDRQQALTRIEEEREQSAKSAAARAEEEALRQRKCEQAQRNAEKLRLAKRMTVEENGERRYLREEEMAERRRINQQRLAEFCN